MVPTRMRRPALVTLTCALAVLALGVLGRAL